MAKKSLFYSILLILCLLCSVSTATTRSKSLRISVPLEDIRAREKDGYFLISLTEIANKMLEEVSKSARNITGVTLFCPQDNAFRELNVDRLPKMLLQYHAVPFKIEKEALESFSHYSKIDTFVDGLPLVVTTVPNGGEASINFVKIKAWNLYDDGKVVVHGIERFSYPTFPISFPLWDGPSLDSEGIDGESRTKIISSLSEVMKHVVLNPVLFLVLVILIIFRYSGLLGFAWNRQRNDDDYLPVSTSPDQLKSFV